MPIHCQRQWSYIGLILVIATHTASSIRCFCTDDHCVPYGVCEGSVCLVGVIKATNAIIRTCGDEPVGCQRELGKWSDLCACDQQLCNTFSYLRSNTRRETGNPGALHGVDHAAGAEHAPPLSGDDVEDEAPLIFQRVDPPLGDFSGYGRPPANNLPTQGSTNTLVFVLVPFSVGCVIVVIVWMNYYRNLC
uniref:Activin_recp domain-containing protein n=1 Tax=Panagrellus redivivus TaxID=6233 RepID=A0A7E4V398_PANRE